MINQREKAIKNIRKILQSMTAAMERQRNINVKEGVQLIVETSRAEWFKMEKGRKSRAHRDTRRKKLQYQIKSKVLHKAQQRKRRLISIKVPVLQSVIKK